MVSPADKSPSGRLYKGSDPTMWRWGVLTAEVTDMHLFPGMHLTIVATVELLVNSLVLG